MKLSKTKALNSYKYSWLLSRIYPYVKPVLGRIILGFIIAVPLGLLDGVTAFALKPYMDYVVGQKDWTFSIFEHSYTITCTMFAYIIPVGVVLFAALQGVLRYLNTYISEWTSKKVTNAVKIDLFSHLVNMDTKFFDENSSGIILSRYLNDPQTAADGLIEQIKTITTSLFGAIGLIAVMLYSSWKLALVGVLILCIAFIPVLLIRNVIRETSNRNMVINGNIRTNLNETYSGNKIMTSYSLQKYQEKKFAKEINNSFNVAMHLIKRSGWMSPLMYLIASFGVAIVLGYGTQLIVSNQLSAGSFASFVTSLLLLYKPVKTLNDSIKFNNVYFEYIENKPVLNNINLKVNKNETVALVGNSGGGKSTIVNLLSRFYDVTKGEILFDDVNIKNFTVDSVRKNISVVFQDNFLYSGTIKENILMGNKHATQDELDRAIEAAYLTETLADMPDGVDTVIGERGTTLSGGQRQRVAIARAFIKNAPIIVLDEATSALDNKSEFIVQKAIDNLMKDKTVFVIAHRLSTIKNADRIIVLNEGNIVETGNHEELIRIPNGYYKNLYEMQFKKQEQQIVNI